MIKKWMNILVVLNSIFYFANPVYAQQKKIKIIIVDSYHPEYLWSQETHRGLCQGLLDFKFLDNQQQIEEYTKNDYFENERIIIKKLWMDTKRKSSRSEIARSTSQVIKEIEEFKPDLILLGDDNAANYIGNHFIDTEIPVVFWGININPLKYGLVNSLDIPGHNITGVYQTGYFVECMEYLKKLYPELKTFAILSDDSETGRAKAKKIAMYVEEGRIPLTLVESVVTNSYEEWQASVLRLRDKVDAFFIVNHNTLKDKNGESVDPLLVASWYLKNIKKPECTDERQFIEEGFLFTVEDSGFKQGYEAAKIAHMILHENKDPALIPVEAPSRGKIILNRFRANMLGLDVKDNDFVEEYIDRSLALEKYP